MSDDSIMVVFAPRDLVSLVFFMMVDSHIGIEMVSNHATSVSYPSNEPRAT